MTDVIRLIVPKYSLSIAYGPTAKVHIVTAPLESIRHLENIIEYKCSSPWKSDKQDSIPSTKKKRNQNKTKTNKTKLK